jgi:hypothetical protein
MNQDISLFHGTSKRSADNMLQFGVKLSYAKPDRDFGLGFYTTTMLDQAASWAWATNQPVIPQNPPAVVEFVLSRDALAGLSSLWFVRGGKDADDLWSLIFHCRNGQPGHSRAPSNVYYDLVIGPVAAFWQQKISMPDCDQISFHTADAVAILNRPLKTRIHPVNY